MMLLLLLLLPLLLLMFIVCLNFTYLCRDSSLPVEILKEVMSQAGLEAFNQSFSVSDPFGDTSSDVSSVSL